MDPISQHINLAHIPQELQNMANMLIIETSQTGKYQESIRGRPRQTRDNANRQMSSPRNLIIKPLLKHGELAKQFLVSLVFLVWYSPCW